MKRLKKPQEKMSEDLKNTEADNNDHTTEEESLVETAKPSSVDDENIGNIQNSSGDELPEKPLILNDRELSGAIEPLALDTKSVEGQELCISNQEEVMEENEKQIEVTPNGSSETIGLEQIDLTPNANLQKSDDENFEGLSDQEVHEEFGGEDVGDDAPENETEAEALNEERMQLNVAARERKVRKEREIFVGGLDRDALEEDIRKVFEYAGEVIAVRMHVDPSTNKNKWYAFVQFATKEQASRALSEMKNPVIHGKRCGTAPSEYNDTLFVGNICNTWTKEAIKQKLKDYGVDGVDNITLVADPRYEGLSRGFAFVEFSSHSEAMLAYKKLQKPDVVFGHSERTAKVAFAEPLREPDPEVMTQVKSVFIDGLPAHWDEDHVQEKFKVFGEIARIMLARNMSTAKRKDFGFVDFNTHEAAVSYVEGVNRSNGLDDGYSKVKVRARLSNPLPKMEAVKGGMCGGFRIGHGSSGVFPRFSGRGFRRGGRPFSRVNSQYGRGFYPRGPGHGGRMGFPNAHEFDNPYPPFHGRPNFGPGGRWDFRDAHQGPLHPRPYLDRVRPDRGYGDYDSYRTRILTLQSQVDIDLDLINQVMLHFAELHSEMIWEPMVAPANKIITVLIILVVHIHHFMGMIARLGVAITIRRKDVKGQNDQVSVLCDEQTKDILLSMAWKNRCYCVLPVIRFHYANSSCLQSYPLFPPLPGISFFSDSDFQFSGLTYRTWLVKRVKMPRLR